MNTVQGLMVNEVCAVRLPIWQRVCFQWFMLFYLF